MRPKEIYETTSNRSIYNKVRKSYLEKRGLLRCSWCPYHLKENGKNRGFYGGYDKSGFVGKDYSDPNVKVEMRINYPNWKIVSKNKKQWMKKDIKVKNNKFGLGFKFEF